VASLLLGRGPGRNVTLRADIDALPLQEPTGLQPVVVSVCRFTGGSNANIIPSSVELEGTVRYLDAAVGAGIPARVERVVRGICAASGATYDLKYVRPYIPTVDDRAVVELGKRVATTRLGPDRWQDVEAPSMGGEDFAYYLTDYPGAMFQLGLGRPETPLHNAHFDFNDAVLPAGIAFLVHAALESPCNGKQSL
jgi:metal-dependent amidase/aminoacylase/carboxypeptidase family protein